MQTFLKAENHSDIIMWQKMKVTDGIKSQKKDKIKVLVLVTPYYDRLGDLLCFVHVCLLYVWFVCVLFVPNSDRESVIFLQP